MGKTISTQVRENCVKAKKETILQALVRTLVRVQSLEKRAPKDKDAMEEYKHELSILDELKFLAAED